MKKARTNQANERAAGRPKDLQSIAELQLMLEKRRKTEPGQHT